MKNIFVFIMLLVSAFSFASGASVEIIGLSEEGRPIHAYHFGPENSGKAIIISGGIHGLYEVNTIEMMQAYIQYFTENEPEISVYIIDNINPDSFYSESNIGNDDIDGYINGEKVGRAWYRFNSNYVDLNRNWDTSSWKEDVTYNAGDYRKLAGGAEPMSESEIQAFAAFIAYINENYDEVLVVNYHSYSYMSGEIGMAQPSYTGDWTNPTIDEYADGAAIAFASVNENVEYLRAWTRYEVPGEFLGWAGDNSYSAIDVEISNSNGVFELNDWGFTHYEQHLESILAVIDYMM